MTGVSSRRSVTGIHGRGRILLKFRPKRVIRSRGLIAITIVLLLVAFNYIWSNHPILRDRFMLPCIQPSLHLIVRLLRFCHLAVLGLPSHDEQYNQHISRNDEGVAVITCNNLTHCVEIQGYLHASDRLLQMNQLRDTVYGTMSQTLGRQYLQQDKLFRLMNIESLANEDELLLSKDEIEVLSHYSKGVNAYFQLKSTTINSLELYLYDLPSNYSFSPWKIKDSLAILRFMYLQWSFGFENDAIDGIFRTYNISNPFNDTDHYRAIAGSSAWAISGNFTTSKGSIIFSDINSMVSLCMTDS